MSNSAELILSGLLFLGPVLLSFGAYKRVRLWKQGKRDKINIVKGLLNIPKRYFINLHDVVARDRFTANMHVAVAGGFICSVLLIYLVYLFNIKYFLLLHALTLCLLLMIAGSVAVMYRRHFRSQARTGQLSAGLWRGFPFVLFLFATSLLILHSQAISEPVLFATAPSFILPIIGLTISMIFLFSSATGFDPLKHAFTGALHLAFHPRPKCFELGIIDSALKPISLNGSKLGVEAPSDFSWTRLLEFDACVQCGRCEVVCPAFAAGQPLNPKKLIQDLVIGFSVAGSDKSYRGNQHPGREGPNKGGISDAIVPDLINADTLWSCTSCRACVHECPMFIDHIDAIVDMRRFLTLEKGETPGTGAKVIENFYMTDNSHGRDAKSRFNWGSDLELPYLAEKKETDILLWVGDGAFDVINYKSLRALVAILRKAGVDFAVLGEEELDTGDLPRRLGHEALFQDLVRRNVATLNNYKFNRILTPDPHVLHCLQKEYRLLGHPYEVIHHTQFILELIERESLQITNKLNVNVTYHDPCYLGRYSGEIDAPRRLIDSLGVTFSEMERSGFRSRCCGGGGGAPITDIPGEKRIPDIRMDDVRETNAEIVVVACPNCKIMLEGVTQPRPDVIDLAELIHEATENV